MKKNTEKLRNLSFGELYNIFTFLDTELQNVDESDKNIIRERKELIREELKRIINNLF